MRKVFARNAIRIIHVLQTFDAIAEAIEPQVAGITPIIAVDASVIACKQFALRRDHPLRRSTRVKRTHATVSGGEIGGTVATCRYIHFGNRI